MDRTVWVMDREQVVRKLTAEELAAAWPYIQDSLECDCLAVSSHVDGRPLMYGNTPEQLIGDDGTFPNARIIR